MLPKTYLEPDLIQLVATRHRIDYEDVQVERPKDGQLLLTVNTAGHKPGDLATENEHLIDLLREQRRQIRFMQESAAQRNRQLDALGMCWCSGGCEGGIKRHADSKTEDEIELLVSDLERNAARARSWLSNRRWRRSLARLKKDAVLALAANPHVEPGLNHALDDVLEQYVAATPTSWGMGVEWLYGELKGWHEEAFLRCLSRLETPSAPDRSATRILESALTSKDSVILDVSRDLEMHWLGEGRFLSSEHIEAIDDSLIAQDACSD